MKQIQWLVGFTALMAGLQLVACGGSSDKTSKIDAASVELVAGTDVGRVVLSERAAERLDIQLAPVRSEQLVRKLSIGAQVVDSPDGNAEDQSAFWVRVQLSPGELNAVDLSKSVLIMPLSATEGGASGSTARAVEPANDSEEPAGVIYFSRRKGGTPLVLGQAVLAEFTLSVSQRIVIPYSAVIYDQRGGTWMYTNPELLTFVRNAITVDYIVGDLAVLSDGPPEGTAVVVVGAAELFGVENGVGGD